MKKFFYNWGPVAGYFSLIFIASSFPIAVTEGADKFLHFLEYALMGFLTTRAVLLTWDLSKYWGAFLGALFGIVLGVVDEFHQAFVPGRMASVWDALADGLGAIFGAFLFVYLGVVLFKSKKLYAKNNPCEGCEGMKR